jgi:hypothetical protein
MSKVFIPQVRSRFDAATKLWIPTVNLRPAEKFGELVTLLPPNANQLHLAPLVTVMRERMGDVTDEDYILALGDPSLIGAASAIMVRKTGKLRMLKWDRETQDYLSVEVAV